MKKYETVADIMADRDMMRAALERVQNFPSHPGGHREDQSDAADDPASWRHGWLCAVAAVQEVAVPNVEAQARAEAGEARCSESPGA
ncbi:MAG: hypothetical protein EKK55_15230 [Rhodocyclaceae bacterium]|nr:MAG: hypothetical protein EKK55_15230 [Rhodocyclaceae bacterium]